MNAWVNRLAIIAFLITIAVPPAWAQKPARGSQCVIAADEIPDACLKEFDQWIAAEQTWREWVDFNHTLVKPDGKEKVRPKPPSWLVTYCLGTTEADLNTHDLCQQYNALKDFDILQDEKNQLTLLALHRERPKKTKWLERIHLDGPWSAAQWPSSVYGVIGGHLAMEVEDRFEVFLSPGILLLAFSDGTSQKQWSLAWDYGIGIRLFDFKVPNLTRTATLHFNLAKAWTLDGLVAGLDVMGLSVTFKQPKKPSP